MPSSSTALDFAQRGHYSQLRAFAGEVLYTEGMPAAHMYVVKEGEVDLYLVRDEKRVVIETLRRGQCFGIAHHLPNRHRAHNAAARSYCELYVLDNASVDEAVEQSPAPVASMLDTLSERLSNAHELIATRVNYQPDLLVYAQLLQLLGFADIGRAAAMGRGSVGGPNAPLARPLLQDVFTNARAMFGHSDKHIRGVLGKLVGLHLLRIEDERGGGKQLVFAPRDIVAQVRKATQADDDGDKLTYEYLNVDEFAALVDVDRQVILKKLAAGEFADDVFTFRRGELLRLLDEKGRRYFVERRVKSPAEFSSVDDLEFADQKSTFAAVAKMDSFDLARLLSTLEEGAVRRKLLGALSSRRRQEVESDLEGLDAVDPMEAQALGQSLVAQVKALMLQGAR